MARLDPALLTAALAGSLLSSCTTAPDPCALTAVFEVIADGAVLALDECTGQMALGDSEDPARWLAPAPSGVPALSWADDELVHTMIQGRYKFEGTFGDWAPMDTGQLVTFSDWQGTIGGRPALLSYGPGPGPSVHLGLQVAGDPDRVSIAFGCKDGERFYGLGARPDGTDHTGKTRMAYTAEQGIGQRDYGLDEIDPFEGRTGDSYFPVPWTVTDRGLGVGMGGDAVARMYLCGADEPGVLRIEAWDDRIDLFLFPGADARDAVSRWTLASGTPAEAPDWAYGPWLASQRGTDPLLAMADSAREQDVPVTAIWSQDWIGGRDGFGGYDLIYHWEWDEETYPDLPGAIETLHDQGIAFLGYFNPFVTEPNVEYEEALANGYLIDTPEGEPYTFSIVTRYGSVVDLLDEDAVAWTRSYLEAAPAMGQDGWMCDFAEWMPFDAQLAGGVTGQENHNRYTLLWQELNQSVLDDALGVGNGVCFNRSGWTGSWTHTPVTWGGDQETDFTRTDGMPTAREIGVGLGLSGVGRYGSDIAGFSSLFGGVSTKELYLRWTAMSAFEPVMRTHDGLRAEDNWRWDTDAESTDHFRRYGRLHLRMLPLFRLLNRDYMDGGVPFMRHGVLVEPRDSAAFTLVRDAADQHFLGDDLLIAPVLEEGATSRTVVLPPGRWYGLLDDLVFDSPAEGRTVSVEAPLEIIPVFGRGGTILPLLDEDVQTSYRTEEAGVLDDGDLDHLVDLLVFHDVAAQIELVDGAVWTWAADDPGPIDATGVTLDGVQLPDCDAGRDDRCVRSVDADAGRVILEITWAEGASVVQGAGWSLSTPEGRGLRSRVELRYPPQ